MYCVRKVNEDYTWIGADSRRLAVFEGVFGVPEGVSYNSYLLLDEETVLFDTVDAQVIRQFRENLLHTLSGRTLDYIVVHHMEPDHTAELEDLVLRFPEVQILCTAMAKTMIGQFFGHAYDDRIHVCKEGDTLCTGRHTLQFVMAPMVHWPEVMMTYDRTDKLLLSADAFGCFGALNGHLYADEVDFDRDYLDECRRYYTNIVGKYGSQVQAVLQKAAGLEISMILPLHGFVWRRDLEYILGKHDLWSRYEPEVQGVMIAYASIYGDTECAANILACRLAEQGIKVQMFDTSVTPSSYILSAAFRYSHLVFAAPTYNAGVFITMDELLRDIAAHGLRGRRMVLLENGSWAPVSGREMGKILQGLKDWTQIEDTFSIRSALREDQAMQLERLAAVLAKDVKAAPTAKDAEGKKKKRFVCKVCGYVYEGDTLPEDYKCPLCGAGAEYFEEK